ncbi:nucleotidyltransferase family protein [soil metagenome]
MKAMILAAGLGTRLKPFTDKHPKALMQINGKSLLHRNVEYLLSYGIKDIIINIHHFPQQIIDEVNLHKNFGINITYSDETDMVLETGGGLIKAKWFFDKDPFLLMNADILTDLDLNIMFASHHQRQPLATLAVTQRKSSRYFLFDEKDTLCGWKNEKTGEQKISRQKPAFKQKAFSGIHIISPEIFNLTESKYQGKFSIIDVYIQLAKSFDIIGFDHTESKFIDVGKTESVSTAEKMFI